MPNYHDHESNHSSRREGRSYKASSWQRAGKRFERDGELRSDKRGYGRDGERRDSRGGERRYNDERRSYGRSRDDQRGYGRDDRDGGREGRRGDNRRGYGRDGERRDSRDGERQYNDERRSQGRDSYKRYDGERRGSWNRESKDDSREYRRSEERRNSWKRENRGVDADRRGDYGRRDERRGGWTRDDRDVNREYRRSYERRSEYQHSYDRRADSRSRRGGRIDDGYRNLRGGEEKRARAKELQHQIPESITADMLPEETYKHLRGLNKDNAQIVARHLVYAGEMMDIDPQEAYQHARAAYSRAARIDIVREALGIAAYVTGRYSEALTELRAYRRFSNDYSHVALEADAERGLGRSEKALRFISEIPLNRLDAEAKIELAIVTSGAKADIGDSEGGLRLMEKIIVSNLNDELAARVELVKADRLEELGRTEEAAQIRAMWEPVYDADEAEADVLVDLDDVFDEQDAAHESINERSFTSQDEPSSEREFSSARESGDSYNCDSSEQLNEDAPEDQPMADTPEDQPMVDDRDNNEDQQ